MLAKMHKSLDFIKTLGINSKEAVANMTKL